MTSTLDDYAWVPIEPDDGTTQVATTEVVRRSGLEGRRVLLAVLAGLAGLVAIVGGLAYVASNGRADTGASEHIDHTEHTDHATYDPAAAVEPPLPAADPKTVYDPSSTVANHDASVVARIIRSADNDTLVHSSPPHAYVEVWTDLPHGFELKALSTDGTKAALVRSETKGDSRPTASTVLIADRAADTTTAHHFDGLIEPEAFATDGRSLFVIDHQAGSEPGTYRVRPLDLETGELSEMLGPDKRPLIEDMNGAGRRQIWGFDDNRLYTLYIRQTEHVHASGHPGSDGFVHILDLTEEWAFCLDLPSTFGKGDLTTTALAVGSSRLAVLDLSAGEGGQLAYASTADRAVTDVIDLPLSFRQTMKGLLVDAANQTGRPAGFQPTVHLAMYGTALAVGVGDAVVWFDGATLEPLAADPDDAHAAYRDRVKLDGPLFGLTNLPGNGVLAWIEGSSSGPVILTAPPVRR